MAMEEDQGENGAIKAAIRSAKKTQRPARIGEKQPSLPSSKQKSKDKARKSKAISRSTSVFDKDLGQRSTSTSSAAREGVRAKKGDKIGGMGKKGGKRKGK